MARAVVLRAEARNLPLPDASVDLIVTSPPYWGLRSYDDDGKPLAGQIGSEETPQEWLAVMLDCTREWLRVLKPVGSVFVNLGDKYDSGTTTPRTNSGTVKDGKGQGWHLESPRVSLGQPKSLLGMPWRYALCCMDDLGLLLRQEIIWSKVNPIPESARDRCRRTHEQMFHFVRQPRYYSAVDEIREPTPDIGWKSKTVKAGPLIGNHGTAGHDGNGMRMTEVYNNPLGKSPGSVWEIASEQLSLPDYLGVDHFAAFPTALVRPAVLGWSPPGICTACGEGRRPVSVGENVPRAMRSAESQAFAADGSVAGRSGFTRDVRWMGERRVSITGYACACPDANAPTRPARVLDPFGGTGTTALTAVAHGRDGITADLGADYCRAARWRTGDSAERAKARGEAKPPPAKRTREDLYGGTADEWDALLAESS